MAVEAVDPDFPCSLVIDVPFPTARLATIALETLSVDKELSPSVRRAFAVQNASGDGSDKTILRTTYKATTNRMLRVSVNAFLDSVGLVVEVMGGLDEDVIESESAGENKQEDQTKPAIEAAA